MSVLTLDDMSDAVPTTGLFTLTTYLDVPWNAPYYRRLGFRHLSPDEETPGLQMIKRRERAAGLEVWHARA